jgi:hypothetical protein
MNEQAAHTCTRYAGGSSSAGPSPEVVGIGERSGMMFRRKKTLIFCENDIDLCSYLDRRPYLRFWAVYAPVVAMGG